MSLVGVSRSRYIAMNVHVTYHCGYYLCVIILQLNEELDESRSEVQKYKRQLQRSEQSIQKLEDELNQVKTSKRRQSAVLQAEDLKEEVDR